MKASSDKKSKPISRGSAPRLRRQADDRSAVPMRLEFEQDSSSVTALKPPAPLPPTPLDGDQDEWLEQVPTHPEQIPDLGALAGRSDTSIPLWARAQRKASVADDDRSSWSSGRSSDRPSDRHLSSQKHHGAKPDATHRVARTPSPSIALIILAVAAFLAVGMVLGALLQSRLGGSQDACPDPAAHQLAPGAHPPSAHPPGAHPPSAHP